MKPATHRAFAAVPWVAAALLGLTFADPTLGNPLQAQYRIDGANPQSLTLVSSDSSRTEYWEDTFALEVSAANLSVGPHYLEVRMKGTNDVWCAWQGQWFRVAGTPQLTSAEWFVDADPGPGLGTPVPLPQDGVWNEAAEDFLVPGVTVTNLPTGRHTLFVRGRDSNDDWGLTNATVFYVADEVSIVAAEWTADPLAAAGTGFPTQVTPGTNALVGEVSLKSTSTTLAVGTNYCATYPLYVRVQDSLGRWSTRGGWHLDAAGANWLFDTATGWAGAETTLVVAPEVASEPVLCDGCLTNNGLLKLSWQECRGVTGYQVFGRGAITEPFTLWASGPNPSYTFGASLTNATYSWMVRSLGGSECFQDGPVWHFTVTSPHPDDADNDGIPDSWERREFGGALFRADGATDWDGDGAKDWQEYVAGTSPVDVLDFFQLAGCRRVLGGVAVDFPTADARNYTVYYALELPGLQTVWHWYDQVAGTGAIASVTNLWSDPHGFFEVSVSAP